MSVNLVCSDPLHSSRSAEAGWAAVLGTGDKEIAGLLCAACAAHVAQPIPPANVLASIKALTPEQQQRLLTALLTGAKPADLGVVLATTTDPKTAPVTPVALRSPRPLITIYNALIALTAAQQNSIWADISSGSPAKYFTDAGPNAAAIAVLDWAAVSSGAAGASLTAAKLRLVAMYCQDVPAYLVNPAFSPLISIAGDM